MVLDLVAIACERSEAIYLGYVFRTYGTEVLNMSDRDLEGSSGLYKSHTFLGETREWLDERERKPVAVREARRNRTLIVLFGTVLVNSPVHLHVPISTIETLWYL